MTIPTLSNAKVDAWLQKNDNHCIELHGYDNLWTLVLTVFDKDTKTSHHNTLSDALIYLDEWITPLPPEELVTHETLSPSSE